jgi:ATPases with chaperone activity, ATP-binding subunit
MSSSHFSDRAQLALRLAQDSALRLGHSFVGSEHLLLGLMLEGSGLAHRALRQGGLTVEAVEAALLRHHLALREREKKKGLQGLTPRLKQAIEYAQEEAMAVGQRYIGTEHLLLGILRTGAGMALRILREAHIEQETLTYQLGITARAAPQSRPTVQKEQRTDTRKLLEQFSTDLTALAACGRLDPVIGREEEIARLIQILVRRTKNNPALVGEPGVGKTAVVEGLAQRIADGKVPQELRGKRLLSLDLSCVVAGTKYRGEFEERIGGLLREVRAQGDVMLFIDELHNLVGTGAAEGAIDAANIFKPALGRGELRLIGATTIEEYRRHIEKDAALERRFQPVEVAEPSEATALEILQGLRPRYEAHHRVKLTDDALAAAVELSMRYLPDRRLPDKAIDLIDEAAARLRMGHGGGEAVEREDIAALLALWTGVPVQSLQQDECAQLLALESRLHRSIIGQEEAVRVMSCAVRRGRAGLKEPERPAGCFLFLGPTGVGKTALCRALAKNLFGSEKNLLRFDMSEYSEGHSVSRLVGAPPGYVGHDSGGQLTQALRRKPYSVVLFDEIEKAHPEVWNLLLQIMEDGQLTDKQGRCASFANALVVMTSNVGAQRIAGKASPVGFHTAAQHSGKETEQRLLRERVMEDVRRVFPPEFLNRIDECIVFTRLDAAHMERITRNMLEELRMRMEGLGAALDLSEEAVKLLSRKGLDPSHGARPLRRVIREHVENPAAELILAQGAAGRRFRLLAKGDRLELTL